MTSKSLQAKTIEEAFSLLQKRFRKDRIDQPLTFYFILDQDRWSLQVSRDSCLITRSANASHADCTITLSNDFFLRTFNRDYTPSLMDLINGKVKCDRPELLLKLKTVFQDA